jgi:hypothetical protein
MNPNRLPILLAALCGCSTASAEREGVTVRDSVGITIVENSAPSWRDDAAWSLSREPALTIGTADGADEYQLYRVQSARRLPDGRIVVGNGGSNQIRMFDPTGDFLGSAGRKGGGPGEFEGLGDIEMVRGDSLLVFDHRLARFTVFNSDLDLGRTFIPDRAGGGTPRPNGVLGDSLVLTAAVTVDRDAPYVPGTKRSPRLHARYRLDGTILDTLGRFPGDESYSASGGADLTVSARQPFGRRAETAVARDRWYIGFGDAYEIEVRSGDGALQQLIRRTIPNRPVPAGLAEERRQWMRDMIRGMGGQIVADVEIPATMPAYGSLLVDAEGNLWVQEYRIREEQPAWAVFDSDGRFLGTVDVPADGEIFEIGADYVLGVWRDDMEVEQIRLYTLHKPSR